MPDTHPTPVAVQSSREPTRKLVAGTNTAGAVGGVLAGVLAAYGGDAIKEVLSNFSFIGVATTNLIVMAVAGVATYYASMWSGRRGGYNVLDRPNIPVTPDNPVAPDAPAVPRRL